jgi:hypothetical protein
MLDKMSVVPCNLVLSRTLVRITQGKAPNDLDDSYSSPVPPNEP